jgi:hypothetical protein
MKTSRMWLAVMVVFGWASSSARAQAPMMLELAPILVATFAVDDALYEVDAEELQAEVESALGVGHLVMGMSDVPDFEDYTSTIYMQGCPPGQYVGCAFVVGGRVQATWVIAAELTSGVDGQFEVLVSYIDVANSKLALEFTVEVDELSRGDFSAGVVQVMDSILAGDVRHLDVRGDLEAPVRQREEREAAIDVEGEELMTYDETLGELDRAEFDVRRERVDLADLDHFEGRQDGTPWDNLDLTKNAYKRFRNSGKDLEEWDDMMRGRFGQLVIGLGVDVGLAPYGQIFDSWYARDASSLAVVHQYVVQEQRSAMSTGVQASLALGLLPWVEVGAFGAVRSAAYQYRFQGQVADQPVNIQDPETTSATTYQVGARIGIIPLPTYPVRPTAHVGLSWWVGSKVTEHVIPPDLIAVQDKNIMMLLHFQPGFEVSAGRFLMLWGRANIDVPVGGVSLTYEEGFKVMTELPPTSPAGVGIGGSLGVSVRAPLFSRAWNPRPDAQRRIGF